MLMTTETWPDALFAFDAFSTLPLLVFEYLFVFGAAIVERVLAPVVGVLTVPLVRPYCLE